MNTIINRRIRGGILLFLGSIIFLSSTSFEIQNQHSSITEDNNCDGTSKIHTTQSKIDSQRIIVADITISYLWHNFQTHSELSKDIITHLNKLIDRSKYLIVPENIEKKENIWGRVWINYREDIGPSYDNGSTGTNIELIIFLRNEDGLRTTWDNVKSVYKSPSTIFIIKGEKTTSKDLRIRSFNNVWEKTPGFLVFEQNRDYILNRESRVTVTAQPRSRYHSSGPIPEGNIEWVIDIRSDDFESYGSPLILNNSLFITVGSHIISYDIETRKEKWNSFTGKITTAGEIIENLIVVGTSNRGIIALEPVTGKVIWNSRLIKNCTVTSLSCSSKIIIVTTCCSDGCWDFPFENRGWVFGINSKDGSIIWKYRTWGSRNSFSIIDSTTSYVITGKIMTCISTLTGKEKWKCDLYTAAEILSIHGSPLIHRNILYIPDEFDLTAFNIKKRKRVWTSKMYSGEKIGPIFYNDKLLIKSSDGYIYAIDPKDGSQDWSIKVGQKDYSPGKHSMIIVDDVLYVGTTGPLLLAMNPSNGNLIWELEVSITPETILVFQGKIYFIGGTKLFCIK